MDRQTDRHNLQLIHALAQLSVTATHATLWVRQLRQLVWLSCSQTAENLCKQILQPQKHLTTTVRCVSTNITIRAPVSVVSEHNNKSSSQCR